MTKKLLVTISLASLISCLLLGSQVLASEVEGNLDTGFESGQHGTVRTVPAATPAAGAYGSTQSVTLAATGSSAICYTTTGTTPVCAASGYACTTGTLYNAAISVAATTTIKAISCYPDNTQSAVVSLEYTISTGAVPPGGGGGGGGDTTPPQITQIAEVVGTTTATITWQTNELATSRVSYGLTATYGDVVSSNTFTISHSLTITGLTLGTTYHYQIKSVDTSSLAGTYTDRTFTTLGTVASGTGTVTPTAGGTTTNAVSNEGSTAKASFPAGAISANTEVLITPVAKAEAVVGNIPTGTFMVGGYVYNFSATAGGVSVTTFLKPVVLTFTYTDAQVSALEESTLKIYWWDTANSKWVALDGTVNTSTNTITLNITHFTYLAMIGEAKKVVTEKPISEMTVEELQAKITQILALISQLQAEIAKLSGTGTTLAFTTDLEYGMANSSEVKRLQEFLIGKTYLATGLNTGNYYSKTAAAVKLYQTAKGITPINGRCGPKTRAAINADLGVSQ